MSNLSSGRVDIADGFLAYHRTGGAKPALVLSHGLTDNGLCWTRLAQALEVDFDVIMLDARGHGDSVRMGAGPDQDPALDLAQAIEQLSLESPIVMGHSVGARTTARYASLYPGRVSGVILEDPPFMAQQNPSITARWQADFRKQIADLRAMTADQITAVGKKRSPTWHQDEFPAWTSSKMQVDPEIRIHDPEPWQDYMARITAPTLLIYGEPGFGGIVTPDIAKASQDLNPQIETAQLAGAGHNTRRENFEAYLAAVVSFLAKI